MAEIRIDTHQDFLDNEIRNAAIGVYTSDTLVGISTVIGKIITHAYPDPARLAWFNGEEWRYIDDRIPVSTPLTAGRLLRSTADGWTITDIGIATSGHIDLNVLGTQPEHWRLIQHVATPTVEHEAANKKYVDDSLAGVADIHQAAKLKSITNLAGFQPAAPQFTFAVADEGTYFDVGEEYHLLDGDRVLLTNQINQLENGIYTATLGAGATVYTLTRSSDANATNELKNGSSIFISYGVEWGGTEWAIAGCVNVITINSDAIKWYQTGASREYIAGAGLSLVGNRFNVGTGDTQAIAVFADNINLYDRFGGSSYSGVTKVNVNQYGLVTGISEILAANGIVLRTAANVYSALNGTAYYLPKWDAAGTTLIDSSIYNNNGKVGIGTSIPSTLLHVAGTLTADVATLGTPLLLTSGGLGIGTVPLGSVLVTGTSTAIGTTSSTAGTTILKNVAGVISWDTVSSVSGVSGTGTLGYIAKWTSGSAVGNSNIFDDGTNVGIGTTSPTDKLTVNGSVSFLNGRATMRNFSGRNKTFLLYSYSKVYTSFANSESFDFDIYDSHEYDNYSAMNVIIGRLGDGRVKEWGMSVSSYRVRIKTYDDGTNINVYAVTDTYVDYFTINTKYNRDFNTLLGTNVGDNTYVPAGSLVFDSSASTSKWIEGTPSNPLTLTMVGGLIGIGTAVPEYKLDICSNSDTKLKISGTGNDFIKLDRTALNSWYVGNISGGLAFDTSSTVAGSSKLIITSAGNVGIGVTNPANQLTQKSTSASESAGLGSELLAAGDTWTLGANWTGTFATGFTHTAGSAETVTDTTLVPTLGYLYQVAFTVTNYTAGSFSLTFGSEASNRTWSSSSAAWGVKATGTGTLIITPSSTFAGTITISIKRITSSYYATYAIQDSAGVNTLEIRSNLAAYYNSFIGKQAGAYNTTGSNNSAMGYAALYSNTTGYYNSAMGASALQNNTTGYYNSAMGMQALYSNTTGYYNSAMGVNALFSNTTGSNNSAMGQHALFSNTTGYSNSAMGYVALCYNTTGYRNSAMGYAALYSNTTGYSNSAMGYTALYSNTTGYYNSAMGVNALYYNTTGNTNSAMGASALQNNTTGYNNSAMGASALQNNTTGYNNSAIGVSALYSNTTGSNNSAMGQSALNSNTTGYQNSAMGVGALNSNTTGYYNSAMGQAALYSNTTGSSNSAMGMQAGRWIADGVTGRTTGNNGLYLGYFTKASADGTDNEIVIGAGATGLGSNSVILGNTSITKTVLMGNVGIGTTNPVEKLQINGNTLVGDYYGYADTSALAISRAITSDAYTFGLTMSGSYTSNTASSYAMWMNPTLSGTNVTGFYSGLVANTTPKYISNAWGGYLAKMTKTGAGTVGTAYGLYVDTQDIAGTNYTIYANGTGKSYFGGNVGIGTTSPATNLHVAGSVTIDNLNGILKASAGLVSAGTVSLTSEISDILPIANGGTNASSKTAAFDNLSPLSTLGDTVYHDGTNNVRLAGNTSSSRKVLTQTGTGTISAAPGWNTLNTAEITEQTNLYYTDARARNAISSTITAIGYSTTTGVLSLNSGYVIPTTTQESTWNAKENALTFTTPLTRNTNTIGLAGLTTYGTANYLVGVNTAGTAWEYKSITGTTNRVSVSLAAGSITLSAPQDIHTGASPTFAGLTLTGFSGILKAAAGVVSAGSVALGSEVSGTLPVANGGTGLSSLGTANYLLGVNASGTSLEYKNIVGTADQITVTPSAGVITLSASQGIGTTSTPTFSNLYLTGLTGNIITTTSVKTSLQELDDSYYSHANTGFASWSGSGNYYSITSSNFNLLRGGTGYVRGKKITFNGGQSVSVSTANTAYYIGINSAGVLTAIAQASYTAATSFDYILLFEVLNEGAHFEVTQENHPYTLNTAISQYIHNNIGIVIRGTGANITRVTTGTGSTATDRQVKIVGSDYLEDHGLTISIPDSGGSGVSWSFYYRNSTGKWRQYQDSVEFPIAYYDTDTNTVTTLPNTKYSVMCLYVAKSDLNSSPPIYIAVIDRRADPFSNITEARNALTNGTFETVNNELAALELAQLGYAILAGGATLATSYIYELAINKSTVNSKYLGGSATGIHGLLQGLLNDDHTQYALLAGRAGGQVLNGGTIAGNTLTLNGTSSGTGDILLNPAGGNVGVGTAVGISTAVQGIFNVYGLTFTGSLGFNTSYSATGTEPTGRMYWDSENHTLSSVLENGVTLQHGQEMHIYGKNTSGVIIYNGQAVSVTAGNGSFGTFSKTDISINPYAYSGLATQDIGINQFGYITIAGLVHDLNTDAFGEGDSLYVSATPGVLSSSPPATPNAILKVGLVVRKHINQGVILVQRSVTHRLVDLSDVDGIAPTLSGQFPVWLAASNYFDFVGRLAGTANRIAKFTDTYKLADSIIYEVSNNIGINTAIPAALLHVAGTARIDGTLTLDTLSGHLYATAGGVGTTTVWSGTAPTPAAHNLLIAATHGDTVDTAVTRGALIVGNATPKWTSLGIGTTAGYVLKTSGTDPYWAALDNNHHSLAGLSDDDHTQYALLAGRAGGQVLYGGTAGADKLTLSGSTAGTGAVFINPGNAGVVIAGSGSDSNIARLYVVSDGKKALRLDASYTVNLGETITAEYVSLANYHDVINSGTITGTVYTDFNSLVLGGAGSFASVVNSIADTKLTGGTAKTVSSLTQYLSHIYADEATNAGTVTSAYHFKANDATDNLTITTQYGLYISALTKATTNWAIYTAGSTPSYFGGTVTLGTLSGHLYATAGGVGVTTVWSGSAPTPAAHNVLDSATHSDTLTTTVVRGSIIVGNSTPKWTALGIGTTAGYVLKTSGTDPYWAVLAKADVGLSNVENTALSTWPGTSNITIVGAVTSGTWNATVVGISYGGTGATTKTLGFNALSPLTTLGDTLYHDGTNNVRLAGNTTSTKKVLTQTGTGTVSAAPAWGTLTYTDVGAAASGHTHSGTYEPVISAGTTSQYWRGDKSWQTLNTAAVSEQTNLYYTDTRARAAISSTVTALTYTASTGILSLTSGYVIPTTTQESTWNAKESALTFTTPLTRNTNTIGLAGLTTVGTANYLVGINTAGTAWEYKSLTGTTNRVTVSQAAGSVTLSGPQDIHTGAIPSFAGLTLTGFNGILKAYAGGVSVNTGTSYNVPKWSADGYSLVASAIYDNNNKVGINIDPASETSQLSIYSSFSGTPTSDISALYTYTNYDYTTANAHQVYNTILLHRVRNSSTLTALFGLRLFQDVGGGDTTSPRGTISNFYSITADTCVTGNETFTHVTQFQSNVSVSAAGAATPAITNLIHFRANDISPVATTTNQYGVYVSQLAGAVNNWAIYTYGPTPSYFGGAVTVVGALNAASLTTGSSSGVARLSTGSLTTGTVALGSEVSGTLPVTSGGTGLASIAAGSILAANTASVLSAVTSASGTKILKNVDGTVSWDTVSGISGVSGTGTTGKIPKWSSASALTDSIITESSSSIGISSTSPQAKLDIAGSLLVGTNRRFSYDGSTGQINIRGDAGGYALTYGFLNNSGTSLGGFGALGSVDALTYYYVGAYGAEKLIINSAGDVGLGINPINYGHGGTNKHLQVYNAGTSQNSQSHLWLVSGATAASSSIGTISWALQNSVATNKGTGLIAGITGSGSTSGTPSMYLTFYTRNTTDVNWTERMRITESGGLGIGTADTGAYKLYVNGDAYFSNAVTIPVLNATKLKTYASGALTAGNWYRILYQGPLTYGYVPGANPGTRASAKITLYDITSGLHSTTSFWVSYHYSNQPTIILLGRSVYGGVGVFSKIRIVTGATYDGCAVEVYCANSCPADGGYYTIENNDQVYGFTTALFTAGSIPASFTSRELDFSTANPIYAATTESAANAIFIDRSGIISAPRVSLTAGGAIAGTANGPAIYSQDGSLAGRFYNGSNYLNGALIVRNDDDNTNNMVVENGGNVGIATSTPVNKLTVYGAITMASAYDGGALVPYSLRLDQGSGNDQRILTVGSASTAGTLKISQITAASSQYRDIITVSSGGYVGINTANPQRLMHVYGGASGQAAQNSDTQLVIESAGGNVLNMLAPNANYSAIYFGGPTTHSQGGIVYLNSTYSGSWAADTLMFRTTGTEKMYLTSAGNLGLGVTNPTARLEIDGNAQSAPKLSVRAAAVPGLEFGHVNQGGYYSTLGGTYTSGYPYLAFNSEADATGNTFKTRGIVGRVIYADLTGGVKFARATNSNAAGQTLTEDVIINSAGNVGVGVVSPRATLEIKPSTNIAQIILTQNNDISQYSTLFRDSSTGNLNIGNNAVTASVSITNTGTVGIGTASPEGKLTVVGYAITGGAATYGGYIKLIGGGGTLTSSGGLEFCAATSGNGYGFRITNPDLGNGECPLYIMSRSTNVAWSLAMSILGSNNYVGIGTATPTQKLDVRGNAYIGGNVASTNTYPIFDSTYSSGFSYARWSTVYGVNADFTGAMTVGGTLSMTGYSNTSDYVEKVFQNFVVFPASQANKAIDIILPVATDSGMWGWIEVDIQGGFSGSNTCGKLSKLYTIGANVYLSGGVRACIIYNGQSRVTDAMDWTPFQVALGELSWDDTIKQLKIPVYHLMSYSNSYTLRVRAFSHVGLAAACINNITFSAIYTQVSPIGQQYPYYREKLGVGISAPVYSLDVAGNFRTTGCIIETDGQLNVAGNQAWLGATDRINGGADYIFGFYSISNTANLWSANLSKNLFSVGTTSGRITLGTTSYNYAGNSADAKVLIIGEGTTASTTTLNVKNSALTSLLTVVDSGNVGIGTANPQYKLDVRGTGVQARFTSADMYGDGGIQVGSKGAADPHYYGEFSYIHANTETRLSAADSYMTFYTSAIGGSDLERLRITMTGNVGIGITNPYGKLDIKAATNQHIQIVADANSADSGAVGICAINDALNAYTPMGFVASRFNFINGNVGIGTNNPGYNLDIRSIGAQPLAIETSASSGPLLTYRINGVQSAFIGMDGGSLTSGASQQDLTIRNDGASGNIRLNIGGTTKAILLNGGNFGIGTVNPTSSLEIYKNSAGGYGGIITLTNAASADLDKARIAFKSGTTDRAYIDFLVDTSTPTVGGNIIFSNGYPTISERMRINSGGNVGIGTSIPTTTLHVYGGASGQAAQNSDTQLVIESAGGNVLNMLSPNANYSAIYFGGPIAHSRGGIVYSNSAYSGGWVADTLMFRTAGAEKMYLTSAGNLGLGVANPAEKLDVFGNIKVIWNDGTRIGMQYLDGTNYQNGLSFNATNRQTNIDALSSDGANAILFRVGTVGTPTERMRITNAGNVGIGVNNPAAKLHIVGNYRQGASFDTVNYHFRIDENMGEVNTVSWDFKTYDFTGGDKTILSLKSKNGNVGIGITNPSELLHINSSTTSGSVLISGVGEGAITIGSLDFKHISYNSTPVASIQCRRGSGDATGELVFRTAPSSTAGTIADRMIIDRLGNVGIGVANPVGHAPARKALILSDTTNDALFEIWGTGGQKSIIQTAGGNTYMGVLAGPGNLNLTYGPNGAAGLIIQNTSGNVGINTTDLGTYRLNVNGNTNITGTLNVSSTFTVGSGTGIPRVSAGAVTVDHTAAASIKAGFNASGGGTMTWNGGNFYWDSRIIVISNGNNASFASSGYFNITCPTSGTITGVGGHADVTCTASGIPFVTWAALYYILPLGGDSTSIPANFRIAAYTSALEVPHNWLLIAQGNADSSSMKLFNGKMLQAGWSVGPLGLAASDMQLKGTANADYLTLLHAGQNTWRTRITTDNSSSYIIGNDIGGIFASKTLTLTQANYVGIGTATPAAPLHVVYPYAKTDTTLRSGISIYSNDAANPSNVSISMLGAAAQANRTAVIQTSEYGVVNSGNISLQAYGGNAGIGTVSPTAKLDVYGTVRSTYPTFPTSGTGVEMFYNTPGDYGFIGAYDRTNSQYKKITINDCLYILPSTNVGIGIANPITKLHINEPTNSSSLVTIGSNAGAMLMGYEQNVGNVIYNYAGKGLAFKGNYNSTPTTQMVIDSNGNVGIDTVSPDAKLDVAGSTVYSNTTVRHYQNLAAYTYGGGVETGTKVITLPQGWTNTMMTIIVQGYDYSNYGAWEVVVSGYNYSGVPNWVSATMSAEIRGRAPFTSVRLGYNTSSSKMVLMLGTVSTVWTYPKLTVSDFYAGHQNISGWGTGWSITNTTTEAGIGTSYNLSVPIPMQLDATNNVILAGNIKRNAIATGYLQGQYPSVESTNTSGAIYTIGGSYLPGTTTLGNMYGIGYGYSNSSGAITFSGLTDSKWGMYVASAGQARVFLDSDSGNIYLTGSLIGSAKSLYTTRNNWVANGVASAVVGQLSWRNYGEGHTIFDASAGLSPDGTAVNNTDPNAAEWQATLPTLMGWNGVGTYGVRVSRAKASDSCLGTAATATTVTLANSTAATSYLGFSTTATGNCALYTNLGLTFDAGAIQLGLGTAAVAGNSAHLTSGRVYADPTAASNYGNIYVFSNDSQAIDKGGVISFGGVYTGTTDTRFAAIKGAKENSTNAQYGGYMAFYTRANGASPAERVRIDSAGKLLVGMPVGDAPLSVMSATAVDQALAQQWAYTAGSYQNYTLKLKQVVTSGVVRWTFDQINSGAAYSDILTFDRGNVGIGITNPTTKLNVNGTMRIDAVQTSYHEGLVINCPTDSPAITYGGISFHRAARTAVADGTTVKWLAYYSYAPELGTGGGGIAFSEANTATRLYLKDGGYVGMGTCIPTSKVHIAAATSTASLTARAYAHLSLDDITAGTCLAFTVDANAPYTASIQHRHHSLNGYAYPLALNPLGGKVGIGTSLPISQLSLGGSTDNVTQRMAVFETADGKYFYGIGIAKPNANDTNSAGLGLWSNTDDALPSDTNMKMFVHRLGNVGIGTAFPTAAKLHIYGTTSTNALKFDTIATATGTKTLKGYITVGLIGSGNSSLTDGTYYMPLYQ